MDFTFKIISDEELDPGIKQAMGLLSRGGIYRSECCTRVCTRSNATATTKQWNKFLEVNAGVVQY